jgi:hypothetical protein
MDSITACFDNELIEAIWRVGFRNSILPFPDARLSADPVTRPLHPR